MGGGMAPEIGIAGQLPEENQVEDNIKIPKRCPRQ